MGAAFRRNPADRSEFLEPGKYSAILRAGDEMRSDDAGERPMGVPASQAVNRRGVNLLIHNATPIGEHL
jgi:hypothetical protein